jgi:hypothetical protein
VNTIDPHAAGKFEGRLFRKYAVYLAALLSIALLASGLTGLFFSYRDTRALVDELEREKARAAASRIEQYIRAIESQLRGALPLGRSREFADIESRSSSCSSCCASLLQSRMLHGSTRPAASACGYRA